MGPWIYLYVIIGFLFFPVPAQAATYTIRGDVAGIVTSYRIMPGDTLYRIARRYDLGIVEVMAANPGIDPWLPPEGVWLTLPTAHILPPVPREGIVINLPELRLYYFPDPYTVLTFPIGIGKEGWATPTGMTKIVKKRKDPIWIPPHSIRSETPGLPDTIPAGPDNPLGSHALNLGWSGFVIHGTNKPYGIGRRSSHGCIRLYPEDIAILYEAVRAGTKVTVVDEPFKAGQQDGILVIEVTPEQHQTDEIMAYGMISSGSSLTNVETSILQHASGRTHIDWGVVNTALRQRSGNIVMIGYTKGYTN